jgi:hypothetical protein
MGVVDGNNPAALDVRVISIIIPQAIENFLSGFQIPKQCIWGECPINELNIIAPVGQKRYLTISIYNVETEKSFVVGIVVVESQADQISFSDPRVLMPRVREIRD